VRYRIEEYVRWEDIDAAGIINYQAYLRFFGLAEAELFRAAGLNYRHLSSALGIALPRVHIACDFHRPATLDELLAVEASVSRIGRTSITLDFEAHRRDRPDDRVASGRYVLVSVRLATFEPVPVPDEIRSRLDPYLETPPAPAR
jgi:YbgC/YbaW family acyl-CoA thioester hydrolase